MQIKTKIVSCHTADSKQAKQEVNSTVIISPLVFPGSPFESGSPLCLGLWLTFSPKYNIANDSKNLRRYRYVCARPSSVARNFESRI
jgi:hypothetical protein